jgi:hypothetical protein
LVRAVCAAARDLALRHHVADRFDLRRDIQFDTQRDYLLLLLFTGMRNGETAAGAGGRTRFRFA